MRDPVPTPIHPTLVGGVVEFIDMRAWAVKGRGASLYQSRGSGPVLAKMSLLLFVTTVKVNEGKLTESPCRSVAPPNTVCS